LTIPAQQVLLKLFCKIILRKKGGFMENRFEKIILVTGATGKQGGAVARNLRKLNWPLRAISRDPSKPSSKALVDMGIEVVQADLEDAQSLRRAARGVYGIFSVQANVGPENEIRQGKLLADVAKDENVLHFVYSSVGGAERNTGIPFFDSKFQIEEYIRSLNIPHTIFRPVYFMENFLEPNVRSSIVNGTLSLPLKPDKPLEMIAVDDIGAFVAMAFEDPKQFLCKAIEIAGDELTMLRAAQLLGRALGREVKYVEMPMQQMQAISPGYAKMFQWFNDYGYKSDITKLRSLHPELLTFANWLQQINMQQFAPAPAGTL
jgi:uncharacterized protein YbjT (DUF2867 family)